jgi:ABC-type sugar transport system substrate-binding protein
MRGLCIQVNDAGLVTPALQQLHVRGIAIVSMVEPAPEKVRFAHVGVDETAVGQELARGTIEGLGQAGGTIMLLHAGYDHPVYGSRYLAFMEGIKTASQVSLLGEFNCHADAGEARQIIRERSQRFPRLTAWVALCDWPLQDGYSPDDIFPKGMRYITFGGYPRQWPLIRNGLCPAIVAVDYKQVGGQALQFCYSAVRDPAQAQRLARVPLTQLNLINVDEYERDWMAWLRDDSQ